MAMDPMMKSPAMSPAAAPQSLSKLLENLKDKYPEDPDVLAAIEMEAGALPEASEDMESEDMGLDMPAEEPSAPESMGLDALFAEDTAPEDDEELPAMPAKKPKK